MYRGRVCVCGRLKAVSSVEMWPPSVMERMTVIPLCNAPACLTVPGPNTLYHVSVVEALSVFELSASEGGQMMENFADLA